MFEYWVIINEGYEVSLNSSNKNPDWDDVARVLEASYCQHKLNIFILIQMNLRIGYFLEYFGKGGVSRV